MAGGTMSNQWQSRIVRTNEKPLGNEANEQLKAMKEKIRAKFIGEIFKSKTFPGASTASGGEGLAAKDMELIRNRFKELSSSILRKIVLTEKPLGNKCIVVQGENEKTALINSEYFAREVWPQMLAMDDPLFYNSIEIVRDKALADGIVEEFNVSLWEKEE